MGGDNAPLEIIKGALLAAEELNADIIIVGDENKIKQCADRGQLDISRLKLVHAGEAVLMEDDPIEVMKKKKDSSMAIALNMLANGEGDALVSAGNTGALLVGSTLYVKRVRGIRRSALAPIIPTKQGKAILIDSGANAECTPEYLLQFAYMGSTYAKVGLGKDNARVGLCNIGAEENKGTELQRKTYQLLKREAEQRRINFVGNIEGRDVALGNADIFVCDGFTGNMILKTFEGVGMFLISELKEIFKSGIAGGAAALLVKDRLKQLKSKVDYKEVGGAPLLGISKPVIKAHGSSDARAFKSAVAQAYAYADSDVIDRLSECVGYMKA